jgi:hypothetical protein
VSFLRLLEVKVVTGLSLLRLPSYKDESQRTDSLDPGALHASVAQPSLPRSRRVRHHGQRAGLAWSRWRRRLGHILEDHTGWRPRAAVLPTMQKKTRDHLSAHEFEKPRGVCAFERHITVVGATLAAGDRLNPRRRVHHPRSTPESLVYRHLAEDLHGGGCVLFDMVLSSQGET